MSTPKFILIMTAIVLAVLAAFAFIAQAADVTYTWTAPTEGSPVVYYVFEESVDGGPFVATGTTPTETYTTSVLHGQTLVVRVAGVDALDRMGPFSVESDPYTHDDGAPGQPGQPYLTVK